MLSIGRGPKAVRGKGGRPPLPCSHLGPRPMLSMHELSLPEPMLSLSMLISAIADGQDCRMRGNAGWAKFGSNPDGVRMGRNAGWAIPDGLRMASNCPETRQMSTIATGLCPVLILCVCFVSTADMCPVSAADICPVSTAWSHGNGTTGRCSDHRSTRAGGQDYVSS